MIEGIYRKQLVNSISPIGYGYVVVPYNVDRDLYVTSALKKEKICVLPDQGSSIILDCYITRSALKEIEFPVNNEGLGSAVIYVTNNFNNKPFIIGVVSKENESTLSEEYNFNIEKITNGNKVFINGDAENADLTLNVSSLEGEASILINCNSKEPGKITLKTNGNLNLNIDGDINHLTYNQFKITSTDKNNSSVSVLTIDNDEINILPNTIVNLGSGDEPIVLGNELQNQLNNTNTYLDTLNTNIENALTIIDGTAGSAGSPAFKSAQAANQLANFDSIKSDVSFTE